MGTRLVNIAAGVPDGVFVGVPALSLAGAPAGAPLVSPLLPPLMPPG